MGISLLLLLLLLLIIEWVDGGLINNSKQIYFNENNIFITKFIFRVYFRLVILRFETLINILFYFNFLV